MLRRQPEDNAALVLVLRKGANWLTPTIRYSATSSMAAMGPKADCPVLAAAAQITDVMHRTA